MFGQFLTRYWVFTVVTLGGGISNVFAQPNTLWSWTFGGSESDVAYSVQQTSDGGFIMAGIADHYLDPNFVERSNLWLIRTDASGIAFWKRTFGGGEYEIGRAVQETSDGGFIIAGETRSFGAGSADVWLVRTDSLGNTVWTKTFGDADFETGHAVKQTADGGFIVLAQSYIGGLRNHDIWLIRTDASGNMLWDQTYGGSGDSDYDIGFDLQLTSDGGYIIAGAVTTANNGLDEWLIRTDALGGVEWEVTHGDQWDDFARSVQQTDDGGFITVGDYFSETDGGTDGVLLRTDEFGNILWSKVYGDHATGSEFAYSVIQTNDQGFTFTGAYNLNKLWLVHTDSIGYPLWALKFETEGVRSAGYSVQQTADHGYITAGYFTAANNTDALILRLEGDALTSVFGEQEENMSPQSFRLDQNYPNPFNPSTTISYSVAQSEQVELTVYNTLGQAVRSLVREQQPAGVYTLTWNGRDDAGRLLGSGLYFYRLKTGELTQTRRMLLLK